LLLSGSFGGKGIGGIYMKKETHRRVLNILRILNRGEIGTEVWETGYYRQIFWGEIVDGEWMRSKISRYGRVKLI
jgi:hypothetical protein